jgi:flagellar biosynthesis protein FliR
MPEALTGQVIAFMLVFARVGAMCMLFPAIGDEQVPPRVRLSFALLLSLIILPQALLRLPPDPETFPALAALLMREILIGLMIGAAVRILVSAVVTAGSIIAMQTGLSMAMMFDPSQGGQSTAIGRFMGLAALVLLLSANLHHLLIGGIIKTYSLFMPNAPMMVEDFALLAGRMVSQSFALGVQMSTPFLVFGLLFNVGLGLIARLTPQIQIFFVAQPLSLLLSLALLAVSMGAILTWYIDAFGAELRLLFGG